MMSPRLEARVAFQASRRLQKYVEEQELGKVQDIWGQLAANSSYIEEPVASPVQERVEDIIEQLVALDLRQKVFTVKRSAPEAKVSEITLDLIDPLLLDILAKHPELIKALIVFQMYEIELQKGTKDGGVDIFALKKDDIFGPHRYLLQAKRWSNAVGIEPVRELLFLHGHHKITRSCLATTSQFTRGAWELARDYAWQLELRDFDKLQEWINLARRLRKGDG